MFCMRRIRILTIFGQTDSYYPLDDVGFAVASGGHAQPLRPGPSQRPAQPASGQQQDVPPEAGGPQNDVGPYAIPKKREEPPPPPPPAKPKKVEGMPDYSIKSDVSLVNVDVLVTTKDGQFIPGLKKENFRVMEDGVQQSVVDFDISQAPITAVLLVEFASTNYYFMVDALNASYSFANALKKNDWVAVISYDMKPHILADFTQDKQAVYGALNTVANPWILRNQSV